MRSIDTLQNCYKCCIPIDVVNPNPCMDVVNPNPCMDVADPDPCMDVANLCMVLPVMVNKNMRVEKPCSSCGPTVMLTVYGSEDRL